MNKQEVHGGWNNSTRNLYGENECLLNLSSKCYRNKNMRQAWECEIVEKAWKKWFGVNLDKRLKICDAFITELSKPQPGTAINTARHQIILSWNIFYVLST